MPTEMISMSPDGENAAEIRRVAAALAEGALVAFPTETVYGLAANAAIGESVERLRTIKGRANVQPFTVHIGRRADADLYVTTVAPVARRLMRKAWPGPLTLIFPVEDPTKTEIHGRLSPAGFESIYSDHSVGVRFPNHPVAAAILAQADAPIIASSANAGGAPPPFDSDSIRRQLGDQIDIILDAGPSRYKQSSTIVTLNGPGFQVVRKGALGEDALKRLSAVTILFVCTGNTCRSPMAAGIFRKMLAEKSGFPPNELEKHGFVIMSAGTMAVSGMRPSTEAVEACRRRGIDITGHRSRRLDVDLIQSADYIYTMGRHHLEMVRSLSPADATRAAPLDEDDDISDPMGGTADDYERAAQRITEALTKRIGEIAL